MALVPSLAAQSVAAGSNQQPSPDALVNGDSGRPRHYHTATTLLDGRILMVGGYLSLSGASPSPSGSVDILDPTTGNWTSAASLRIPRARHAATLLPDGRVAVSGGVGRRVLDSVEIYDPNTDLWTSGARLPKPMSDHAMVASGADVVLSGGGLGVSALTHRVLAKRAVDLP